MRHTRWTSSTSYSGYTNITNITTAHCNATNATDVSFRDRCNPPGGSSGGVDVQALIGIFLAALSALISSVALVIMKRSADVEVGLPLCKRCPLRWWTLMSWASLVCPLLPCPLPSRLACRAAPLSPAHERITDGQ